MTAEREFYPDLDIPDSDTILRESDAGAIGSAANRAAQKRPPVRRREIYMSSRVYRDGEPVELQEVLWIEEPDYQVTEAELTPGRYEAPNRATNPYAWEQFWRQVMRHGPPTGRWRAGNPETVVWSCQWCGLPMEVRSKGRPPKYHKACRTPAWRASQPKVERVA